MAELGREGIPKRGIYGWMMFDWAAQPFFTVVTTFIFGPYFVAHFAGSPEQGQTLWGYAAAAAGLIIAIEPSTGDRIAMIRPAAAAA